MTGRTERRFALDPSYRRPGDGAVVVAGSPLVVLRLGTAGVRIARSIEAGEPPPAGHGALTERLLDIGAIHPLDPPAPDPDLTIVVPAHGEVPAWLSSRWRTIVVDDASAVPVQVAEERVEVLRRERNGGPGAARSTGLAAVTTELVAFVDCDVTCSDDDLAALAGAFTDPRVALVAPRVRAHPAPGALAAFEADRSPLDLGSEPGRIAPGTRISYVPAALVVCRTSALHAVGGFDPALRYGEDVDLVWRLHEAGWRCRYDPSVVVRHRTRPDLRAWLHQRYRYGTSAGPLALRHPGALAPVRTSGWSAGVWAAVAAGHPLAGAGLAVATAAALERKLPDLPRRETWRLALSGHLWTGRLLAEAWMRAWLPLALVLATTRRGRRWLAAGLLTQAATSRAPRRWLLRVLDDAAYGAGVWCGAWRSRAAGALLPGVSGWPGRRDRRGASSSGVTRPR